MAAWAHSAALVAAALTAAAPYRAVAAGIEVPDGGAVGLGQGGALAALPETALALRYNPAGLAQQRGLRGEIQGVLSWQQVRFDPGNGSSARNSAMPWAFPTGGAMSLGMGPRGPLQNLTLAVGAVAPNAGAAKMSFPAKGPQRYALIDSNLLVVFPTAAVAVQPLSWLHLGISGQLAYTQIAVSLAARPVLGILDQFDAIAHVAVQGGLQPTWNVGAAVTPTDWLALGASLRPAVALSADGTLSADIPPVAAGIGVVQHNNGVTLRLTLPPVLRAGARVRPLPGLTAEVDYVFEGWSAFDAIRIETHDIVFTTARGVVAKMPDVAIPEHFVDAHSARLGVAYALWPDVVTVRAGVALETSAIPLASTSVMFPNWGARTVGVGGTLSLFGCRVDLAYGHTFTPARTVTHSIGRQTVTPNLLDATAAGAAPQVVGNGTYQSALDVVALSLGFALDDVAQPARAPQLDLNTGELSPGGRAPVGEATADTPAPADLPTPDPDPPPRRPRRGHPRRAP